MKINDITKEFKPLCGSNNIAVNQLSLAVELNEKFGILGFNGGGKSTTFKAIVDEVLIDQGNIEILGMDNKNDFDLIIKSIGYCPQQHALFDYMTVEETIDFYAQYKQMRLNTVQVMEEFNLIRYRKTYAVNLSGGNKRKLNFCLALMFFPKIALLDEPTTGVDADARRTISKLMGKLSKKTDFSMMLTTHTMEEAEMLCDRVGWMSRGNFICIGVPEELKIQYSTGFKVQVAFTMTQEMKDFEFGRVAQDVSALNSVVNLREYEKAYADNTMMKENLYHLQDFVAEIQKQDCKVTFDQLDKRTNYLSIFVDKTKKSKFLVKLLELKKSDKIHSLSIGLEKLDDIFMRFQ